MAIYLYQNPETEEVKEIWQGMNDVHEYFEEDKKWQRLFTKPYASVDGVLSNVSQSQFLEKTSKMKGTVGDMLDYSAELSEKRSEANGGTDPLKKKHFADYKKEVGKDHFSDRPNKIETKTATIDF
mgnify:FL=1|tara:strand:+ start:707 stop:1084 length:378 start_codon:yes stop_codon:yes gene_type:complete